MESTQIEMAVLDVDGTMVDSPVNRTPSAELCRAVKQVAERGVRIGLASGRNYGHIMSQMRSIGFNGPIISNNGAYVVMEDTMLFERLLDGCVTDTVIRQSGQLHYMVEFSGRNVMYTYKPPGYTGPVFPKEGTDDYLAELDGSPEGFARMRADRISKITMLVDNREKAGTVTAFWANGPLKDRVCLSSSFWYCLELTAPGVSKGRALKCVAGRLGIPLSHVMAIGDGDNDVQLLEAAGISFAMANGSERALQAGKYRAPSVREDGARQVLERYILKGEPLPPPISSADISVNKQNTY